MEEKIKAWKKEHGRVFKTTINEQDYIWRTLKRKEYLFILDETAQEIKDNENKSNEIDTNEEKFIHACLLSPENFDFNLEGAGLVSTLIREIMHKSGFTEGKTEEI